MCLCFTLKSISMNAARRMFLYLYGFWGMSGMARSDEEPRVLLSKVDNRATGFNKLAILNCSGRFLSELPNSNKTEESWTRLDKTAFSCSELKVRFSCCCRQLNRMSTKPQKRRRFNKFDQKTWQCVHINRKRLDSSRSITCWTQERDSRDTNEALIWAWSWFQ